MKLGVSLISSLMLLPIVNALLLFHLKLVLLDLCSFKDNFLMLISPLGHSIKEETTHNLNVVESKWLEV